MKELNDEDIQRLLEQGEQHSQTELSHEQEKEIETYRLLFDALKEELPGGLPYHFAAGVTQQVQVKTARKMALKFYILTAVLIMAGVVSFYFGISYFNKGFTNQLINAVSPYKWILIFSLCSLFIIQFLDQLLIKKFNVK